MLYRCSSSLSLHTSFTEGFGVLIAEVVMWPRPKVVFLGSNLEKQLPYVPSHLYYI